MFEDSPGNGSHLVLRRIYLQVRQVRQVNRGGNMHSLTIRLPEKIDSRLNRLAKRTHRTKTFYVREAILSYLEDLEDTYDALKALKEPGKNYSMAEVVRDLDLTEEE